MIRVIASDGSGASFFGYFDRDETVLNELMESGQVVKLTKVRAVTVFNVPMPGGVSRQTILSNVDFCAGPIQEMHLMLRRWYSADQDHDLKFQLDEEEKKADAKDEEHRAQRAAHRAGLSISGNDPNVGKLQDRLVRL